MMKLMVSGMLLAAGGLLSVELGADDAEVIFPGETWAAKTPAEAGLDVDRLKEFSRFVGGRGCVVRHGYMAYSWGDVSRRADVASACKPLYSHLLFRAVEDGKIESLDEKAIRWEPRLKQINKELGFKDADITWRHFANQTSCYQLVEKPGTAYAYNDWQMALFWDTLFLKVYGATYGNVDDKVFRRLLTDPLQCQDKPTMMAFGTKDRPGRVGISVRDFARFGLLYMRQGNWKGQQLISRKHAVIAVTSPFKQLTEKPLPATVFVDESVDLGTARTVKGEPIYDRQLHAEQLDHSGRAYGFGVFAYRVRCINDSGDVSGPSPAFFTIPSSPQHEFSRDDGTRCRLKWKASSEKRLAGYRVYRMDGRWNTDSVSRLTADPLAETQYVADTAGKNSRRYYVVAVDALGQEGFPSSPVWFQREWRAYYNPFVGPWHQ